MIVHSKLWGLNLKSNSKETEEKKSDLPNISLTTDGSFVYMFSSKGYITKIGSGYNNTMLGRVYKTKENYRVGEKGTIVFVENIIYFRSPVTDPNPLIGINPSTLEEIPLNYELNSNEINYLWVEGKKSEFEFPHTNYKDLSEIIEKKKNLGLDERSNLRPSSSSPITTDGRFIYVFSKWYDEVDAGIDENADDEDKEEAKANANKKTTISIYGVSIYDPLSNMMHVRSVKLNFKKEKSNSSEKEQLDLLKQGTILYTNGNIFIVDKYKFSLVTGDETDTCPTKTDNLKVACYDQQNNVIWGVTHKMDGNNEKIDLNCFFNHSAKPIVEYPSNHSKYMPCSLEKIIQFSEDKINLKNKASEVSMETFLKQNTLNILNLEDKFTRELKRVDNVILKSEKPDSSLFKKSIQCLILSTIAKLSEYYGQVSDLRSANTDEDRGKILASACRRPYCVKLEPETFELLINFLNMFSQNFFSSNEGRSIDVITLENYCLLSTVKILKTNLKCLSISALDLDLFIKRDSETNPFLKIKEFILRIFTVYHKEKRTDDIIKALYEECKIILQVSVNTLYPVYKDIIDLLTNEMERFKESSYSRDIVLCLLEWMTIEDNMKNLLRKLKKEDILKIFEIFKIVSIWEINVFSKYIKSIKSLKTLTLYDVDNSDETIAFKFSSNMQIEILKSISQKLLNDNYDEIENEQILQMFSNIIFENVLVIFREIRELFEHVPNILEKDWNDMNSTEEEIMIDTSKPIDAKESVKDSNEPKTFTDFRSVKFTELWTYIKDTVLTQKILILRTFNFHIDCLSLLSSNFIISSLMLKSFNEIIKEMNQIYILIKEIPKNEIKEETSDYKEIFFESDHPYLASQVKWFTIDLPGEKEVVLEFDPQCNCKTNCAYVQLYTDMNMTAYAFPEYVTLNQNFPKVPITCTKLPVYLYFYSDGCVNSGNVWGFKVKVHNGKKKSFVVSDDKFTTMMRSVSWVACKCSGQLLKGNFIKLHQDDDDFKYNSILNSKLFAGGIDFEDVKKDNDQFVNNILNIFNNILPETTHDHEIISPDNLKEKKLLLNILNGDNLLCNKVVDVFQKKFSKEVVWARIGGDQADKLVRAAYASLLRHSSQSLDFDELVSTLELCEEVENTESNENIYFDLITTHKKFMSLYKKWQAASRMRTWLIEKKKNVDEALERNKTVSSNKKTAEEEKKEISEEEKKEIEDKNISEEIMRKIIDQTIIKAKFLLRLKPSPIFSENEGHKDKNFLVRNTSIEVSTEDSWKTRLHQWKTVQKSKRVLKSVEEEAQSTLSSLTSSVMMCLQSTVSSK